jgi:ABC-type sugar transport system ATPase subunit
MDKVMDLSAGQKQMLQILKALRMNAKIISLDEPTSSLTKKESDILFEVIRELKERGVTILYISHKLDEIYNLCDRATVLRDGQYIATFHMGEVSKDVLIKSMIGRNVSMFAARHKPSAADLSNIVLEVDGLSGPTGFSNVSFKLAKGEILGFFGLVGAGRTEVMRAVFGADSYSHGKIIKNGKVIINKTPADGVSNGIGLIPENRKEQGFVATINNADNISLASLKKYVSGGFLRNDKKTKNAVDKGQKVGLSPNDPNFKTRNLSGGNAQKVVIAKWLSTDADILIFDEPTKGIDVGAKAEIYQLMEELVSSGKSIIMVSSELPEVIGMSDRIVVMNEGNVTKILDRSKFSEDTILTYALEGVEL